MLRDVIDKLSLIVTTNTCQINSLTQGLKSLQNKQGNNTKLLNKPTKIYHVMRALKNQLFSISTLRQRPLKWKIVPAKLRMKTMTLLSSLNAYPGQISQKVE
jgi:hypothetical protein